MPIKFKCPSCDQMLGIARRKAGSVISCPRCSYPATVPAEEGETARPAAVGRAAAARPAFERRDFERWIGDRPPVGNGGTAIAEPPSATLPNLSEKHTGLLDQQRERRQQSSNSPVIDVRLAVALILGLGLLAFGGGFWMGRNSSFTKPTPGAALTDGVKSAKAVSNDSPSKPAESGPKFALNGTVTYRAGEASKPDAGARILAFPLLQKPLKKVPVGGLRPLDEKGIDQTGTDALNKLGGAAATADANGNYTLNLPKEDTYWVLVISKNVSRSGPVNLQVDEQKLQDYFDNVNGLLGDKDYAFARRGTNRSADGSVTYTTYSPYFAPLKP